MIERVEQVLIIWGEEYRTRGLVAALPCTLGAAIDNRGVMIRSTVGGAGSELYSGDLGQIGQAVEQALVAIRQPRVAAGLGTVGGELVRMARIRYLTDPMPLIEHQMRRLGYRSDRTYRDKLHQLHTALEPYLLESLPWLKRVA